MFFFLIYFTSLVFVCALVYEPAPGWLALRRNSETIKQRLVITKIIAITNTSNVI